MSRLLQFEGPAGAFYLRISEVVAVGPETKPDQKDDDRQVRTVYLRGGHVLSIYDDPNYMVALLEHDE